MVDHENIFLSSTLIIMQNSCIAVCHAIYGCRQGGPKKFGGTMGPHILGMRA